MAKQIVNLTFGSPVDFVNKVLEMGKEGYTLHENTYPRLKGFPITASLVIETDKTVKQEPGVQTIPVPLKDSVFTAEDLEAMEWEDFKDAVQSRGVKGRQRGVMQAKYLAAVESGKDNDEQESEEESSEDK